MHREDGDITRVETYGTAGNGNPVLVRYEFLSLRARCGILDF